MRANSYPVVLLLVLGSLLVGFISGHGRAVPRLLSFVESSFATATAQTDPDLPDWFADEATSIRSFFELDSLLNRDILRQRDEHADRWLSLLGEVADQRKDNLRQALAESVATALGVDEFRRRDDTWPGEVRNASVNSPSVLTSGSWFSTDQVDVSLVRIETLPGVTMTGALLVPRDLTEPAPAILALHGYDGTLTNMVFDQDYHHGVALDLASRGYVVFAPYQAAATVRTRNTLYVKALVTNRRFEALNLRQLARAVDYLSELPIVDRSRLGVYGVSIGGRQALHLGALDQRLSMVAVSAHFTERFPWLWQRITGKATRPPDSTLSSQIHPFDTVFYRDKMGPLFSDMNLIALIYPRHVIIVSGIDDPRHEGATREFEHVKRFYRERSAEDLRDHAHLVTHSGGHETAPGDLLDALDAWSKVSARD